MESHIDFRLPTVMLNRPTHVAEVMPLCIDAASAHNNVEADNAIHALILQSWAYIQKGQAEQGLPTATQALELAQQPAQQPAQTRHQMRLEAIAQFALSLIQEDIGDNTHAFESRLKALTLLQRLDDALAEADCRMVIGLQCLRVTRFEDAITHLSKSVQIYALRQHPKTALAFQRLAQAYLQQHNLAQAQQCTVEALIELRQPKPLQKAAILHTQAEIALAAQPPSLGLAQHYLTQATALVHRPSVSAALRAEVGISQARLHNMRGEVDIAIETLKALANDPTLPGAARREVIGQIYLTYKQAEQFESALEYHRQYNHLRSEHSREQAERQIHALRIMHETREARRVAEISRLKTVVLEKMVQDRTQLLERTQMEMLERLAMAVETRDSITGDHVTRVGDLSARIAAKMGFPEVLVERIRLAARLHDIGKIGIPDSILLKRSGLTAEEYHIMKSHTIKGALMLANSPTPLFRMAEEIALSHHERWDGKGYPHKLAAEQIPIAGRIVAVADAFDAMISVRPYKSAMPVEHAIAEVMRCSGTQFDPVVVKAFLAISKPEMHTDLHTESVSEPAPNKPQYWSVPLSSTEQPVFTSVSITIA